MLREKGGADQGGRGVVAVGHSAGHVIGAADSVTRPLPLALLRLNTADLLWHNPPTPHPRTTPQHQFRPPYDSPPPCRKIHQLPFHQFKAEWVHLPLEVEHVCAAPASLSPAEVGQSLHSVCSPFVYREQPSGAPHSFVE